MYVNRGSVGRAPLVDSEPSSHTSGGGSSTSCPSHEQGGLHREGKAIVWPVHGPIKGHLRFSLQNDPNEIGNVSLKVLMDAGLGVSVCYVGALHEKGVLLELFATVLFNLRGTTRFRS